MVAGNLQFRVATLDDAAQLQQLVQTAFRTEDSRQDWTGNVELASSFKLDIEEVKAKISNPDMITLIAFDNNNALIATIDVSRRGADFGRLSMIAVDNRYQRGGVGRQVLSYAENYCRRTLDVKKFSLNALSTRKSLIEWYIRRGYQKTGETTPFPLERHGNLALPDDICFIEMEKDFSEAS
ncbi:hypothetical protein B7463_g4443, partial [Scytalidium lignicola]